MKNRFLLPICLFAVLAFPAWGATLLYEGFDGMEKGKLPKGWECSEKIEYYTNEKTYPTQPCLTLGETEMIVTSRTFPVGATNVSFTSYTANNEGECNQFKVEGWADGQWSLIYRWTNMPVKTHNTFSCSIDNPETTRVRIEFIKTYNASLDDILVEGPFSVTFDQKDDFRLPEGTGDAITATANYDFATPDTEFNFEWSGDLEGTNAVLEIPDNLKPGTYQVTCTATVVGDEETSTANSISFQVLKYHEITIAPCEHGTLSADAERAVEGTIVRVEAVPESEDYGLLWLVINGENQPRGVTEFKMPDADVTVTAVFTLKETGDLVITFDGNTSKNPAYAATEFVSDAVAFSTQQCQVAFSAVQCQGGDDGSIGYDGDKAMRVRHSTNGIALNGYFATAEELQYPIDRIYFEYKAYSSSHVNRKWALETSPDGAKWTNLATVSAQEGWGSCNVAAGIPENSFFFRIISSNTVKSSVMAVFDNIHIWYGTPSFRVKLSGVKLDERVVCDDDNPLVLTATGLDGTEPYDYAWKWTVDGDEGGTAEGDTCTFSETGAYEVEVTCTDGDGAVATASTRFTIEKQYRVICPPATNSCAIVASTNKAFAGDTVTVEVKPKLGFTLDGDLAATCSNGELVELIGNSFIEKSFEMPAGDVVISGTFRAVRDVVPLPFEHHGPWQATVNMLDGVTGIKIGTDYDDKNYDGEGNGALKFGDETSIYEIHFDSTPGELSYMIRGNSLGACICTEFLVQESVDGTIWTNVMNYPTESDEVRERLNHETISETFTLNPDSRHVKFGYKDMSKGSGSIGVDAIVITKGEDPEPVAVTTTLTEGGISFEDGSAKLNVVLEPAVEIAGGDIWSTTNLVTGEWQPAPGASVEGAKGKYLITVPDSPGTLFISVGKPGTAKEE